MTKYRINKTRFVDQTKTLSFTFDGKKYHGYEGDTLASALISNGIHYKEIKENGIETTSKNYEAICNYIQSDLKW